MQFSSSKLLRSEDTTEFDLLNVGSQWRIWISRISTTTLTYTCNECNENSDCNLNGVCTDEGECVCDTGVKTQYMGTHCEVKLKNDCGLLRGGACNIS